MLDVITKLLILQDRDGKILQTEAELSGMQPQRQALQVKLDAAKTGAEVSRSKLSLAEASRKKSELDVEAQKQLIEKYSLQQFQTKKNEEYRALAHEIEGCRGKIRQLEDQQLEFMEQADSAHKELAEANARYQEIKRLMESQLADLAERESNLSKNLESMRADRDQLTAAVESGALARYERLLKHKGGKVVVGVEHGVCGGCHMTLPPQSLIACQGHQELISCPNCSRILFHSPDMDLTVAQ